jgi:biopolymer transport protein ExbB
MMFELFKEGGFIMYPLLFCSVLVWAVAIEKFWSILKFKKESKSLQALLVKMFKENKLDECIGVCKNAHPFLGSPYQAILVKRKDSDIWEQNIGRRVSETQLGLKRFLWILGTIGNSAPFIGLFGTVIGIIKSFESISRAGKSGFAVVAAGLSEALIATAAGIIVAVIAVIFYNYFHTRLQVLNLKFKHDIEDFMDLVKEGQAYGA